MCVNFRRALPSKSSLPCSALATPEIQIPFETGVDILCGAVVALANGRQRCGHPNFGDASRDVYLRLAVSIGLRRFGLCLARARVGFSKGRVVVQGLGNQCIELAVAQRGPPVSLGPRGG